MTFTPGAPWNETDLQELFCETKIHRASNLRTPCKAATHHHHPPPFTASTNGLLLSRALRCLKYWFYFTFRQHWHLINLRDINTNYCRQLQEWWKKKQERKTSKNKCRRLENMLVRGPATRWRASKIIFASTQHYKREISHIYDNYSGIKAI